MQTPPNKKEENRDHLQHIASCPAKDDWQSDKQTTHRSPRGIEGTSFLARIFWKSKDLAQQVDDF